MLVKLVLGIAAMVAAILLLRWFLNSPPQSVARGLRRLPIYAGLGAVVFLAATGRLHWLFAALGAIFAFLPRLFPLLIGYLPVLGGLYKRYKAARSATRGGATGQVSHVETRYVRMTLNHDTGEIDGMVIDGRFKGARLTELPVDNLIELLRECRVQDEESAQLVQAFLDNVHGEAWRDHAGRHAGAENRGGHDRNTGPMNREEAYEILGLQTGASEEDIIAAHRRLMQKLHPDRGGSGYLAAKINQAKDMLLGS